MSMTSTLTRFIQLINLLALASMASSMNADTATYKTLFDFQVSTHLSDWEVVNDGVMGGVSTGQFQLQTNGCAVFSGTVRLENNGGFASVRSAPLREALTGCNAFVVRLRGDGRRYKFSVRTGTGFDTPLYQCSFITKEAEWEEHRLAFSDLVPTFRGRVLADVPSLNPAKVTAIGFLISDKQAGPFRLEIEWIKVLPDKL